MTKYQNTYPHDAKVKVTGYNGMYECTRRHRFIRDAALNVLEKTVMNSGKQA